MTRVLVRPLRRGDNRSGFRSGSEPLDQFFARYAGQHHHKLAASVTYVAEWEEQLAGYVTVTAATVDVEELAPEDRVRYPYPLPVLSLARMATDERHRSQGIGGALLRHVLGLAAKMADEIGCVGVVVDAKAGALGFYERFGFRSRLIVETTTEPSTSSPLFLKISTIRRGLAGT